MRITKENRELFDVFKDLVELVNELLPDGVVPLGSGLLEVDRKASKVRAKGEEVLRIDAELLRWTAGGFSDDMYNREAVAGVKAVIRFLRNQPLRNQPKGQAK